jgi:hypothetical protein
VEVIKVLGVLGGFGVETDEASFGCEGGGHLGGLLATLGVETAVGTAGEVQYRCKAVAA